MGHRVMDLVSREHYMAFYLKRDYQESARAPSDVGFTHLEKQLAP